MTDLFLKQIAQKDNKLMQKVWSPTPYMVDFYTDNMESDRYWEIRKYLREKFGQECSPIHSIEGDWQFGGATLYGWTWIGFKEEWMMEEFESKFTNKSKNT